MPPKPGDQMEFLSTKIGRAVDGQANGKIPTPRRDDVRTPFSWRITAQGPDIDGHIIPYNWLVNSLCFSCGAMFLVNMAAIDPRCPECGFTPSELEACNAQE